jgi:hypothetical protein
MLHTNDDEDLNDTLSKFQNIRVWSNCKNPKEENQERNKFKILQNYVSSSALYDRETWTVRKRDRNRIQAAEMKSLRTVKGCTG